ncbi:MAG: transporter substrate-binding domain-containing protein [Spirochaetaceae bacterium]|jgi:L-cystine transport system substrate-binding protein|nr:transporter substrate-binding domain-containing protein [Spirochaetaceae bacterium]
MMKKRFAALAALVLLVSALSGCGGKKNKIVVGMTPTYVPFCYVDENGEKQGYDYQVLRAVDELLEDYEFEFEPVQFANLTPSLKDGHFDIATCQFEKNPEREDQFLFSGEHFFDFATYLVVRSDNTAITDMASLNGRVVGAAESSNQYTFATTYLASHPELSFQIKPYSTNKTNEEIYIALSTGDWDAALITKFDLRRVMAAYPAISLRVTSQGGDEYIVSSAPTYFMFNKSQGELLTAVDGALRTLKAGGRLNEIQAQELGAVFIDFTR